MNITVPAYKSDSLQVRLVRGETSVMASWLGDESWEASIDVPSKDFATIVVFFFDQNGEVLLASQTAGFETGTNTEQTQQVDAIDFQFWDTDFDGVDNIDELRAGTDPFEIEGTPPATDYGDTSFPSPLDVIARASGYFEALTPAERPYVEVVDDKPDGEGEFPLGISQSLSVDIDALGNGSYSEDYMERDNGGARTIQREATRSRGEASVSWTGSYLRTVESDSVREQIDFATETRRYSDGTFGQSGKLSRDLSAFDQITDEISYSVIGGDSGQGDGECTIASGSITVNHLSQLSVSGFYPYVTTLEKSADEDTLGWQITVVQGGVVLENYVVLNLGASFYCNYADLQP